MLSIAHNRAIDLLRKRHPTADVEESSYPDPELVKLELADVLNALNDEEKQSVLLHIYGGLSHKEIGKVLNISAVAAQKKYRRALLKLKKLL